MWFGTMLLLGAQAGAFHVDVGPGEKIWVEVRGSGSAVVLVPGLFGCAYAFRHVAPLLEARGYRTIIIEPLGIGRSSRPATADYSLTAQSDRVAAVLDTLDVSGALLVAHSVSASIAYRLAYRRPELVRGLLSLDGGAAESVTSASFRRTLRFAPLLKLFGGKKRLRTELTEQLRGASGNADWVTRASIDGYAASFSDLDQTLRVLQAMARAREPESLTAHLAEVRAPVLLLVGAASTSVGLSDAEVTTLRQRIPSLTIHHLPGIGHYIHEEAPDSVVAALVRLDCMSPPSARALHCLAAERR